MVLPIRTPLAPIDHLARRHALHHQAAERGTRCRV